jgi:hypothetical protein
MDFSFLKSVRFWKLVLIGLVAALQTQGAVSGALADAVYIILGGSVVIKTVDRASEKLGGK